MDEYIGVIKYFTTTYVPSGYMKCNGAFLQIVAYTTLYSVIGTTYGETGPSTFALPKVTTNLTGSSLDIGWCICTDGVYPTRP